jgi:photosystem II stability/assembly factor-like uncharacterized protein
MKAIRSGFIVIAATAALSVPYTSSGAGFVDPLDMPAQPSPLASKSLLQAVTHVGDRMVAVGQRGHVLVSTDSGATWKQGTVPVSSDLTSVFFVNDKKGWAVGHDGVILNTVDGGDSWTLQLDGRRANDALLAAMEKKAAAEPSSEEAKALLTEAQRYKDQGADKPFLDVWFADENIGYAVGAYNLIVRTTDGGKTWEPWFDRTENPKFFNLYAIRPAADGLYIAGEGGIVLKLDQASQRFKALSLPYKGSFFGVADAGAAVLVFGLRGNVYRSDDGGKTWAKVEAGLPATVVGSAKLAGKGAVVLADLGGRAVVSDDAGRAWKPMPLDKPMPLTGIADAGNGRLALVGPRGVAVTEIAAR